MSEIFLDLKKEIDDTTVKDITDLFGLKIENKAISNRIIRDIRSLFEHEEEHYYKPVRFWSNNFIEYESNRDRNKTLSAEEYLNKVMPYLKDIINNLKKIDTWKIQLTMRGIDFIFDCVLLLRYKCHKINFKQGGSYVDSPDWIKDKKATINSINKKKIINAFNTL